MHLIFVYRRKEQLVSETHGHDDVGQVEALQLWLHRSQSNAAHWPGLSAQIKTQSNDGQAVWRLPHRWAEGKLQVIISPMLGPCSVPDLPAEDRCTEMSRDRKQWGHTSRPVRVISSAMLDGVVEHARGQRGGEVGTETGTRLGPCPRQTGTRSGAPGSSFIQEFASVTAGNQALRWDARQKGH